MLPMNLLEYKFLVSSQVTNRNFDFIQQISFL